MNIWLAEIWQAWRASLRRPGFLLLAVGVLALGVGASATVFTLVDHALLRPLPFPQPHRLVVIGQRFFDTTSATPGEYQHLKHLDSVASTGFVENYASTVNVLSDEEPQQISALFADRHLLPTLGLHVAVGRNFNASEDRPHGSPAVLLSHGYWQRTYGGNADAIGKELVVKGVPHTIVGVLPASFDALCDRFSTGCDIVLPMALSANSTSQSDTYLLIARMDSGTTASSVAAEVNARMRRWFESSSHGDEHYTPFSVVGLADQLHVDLKSTLALFMGCALFVLLVALVNLANLLFLRTLSRHHEVAIREALGASTLRRSLPTLAESFLIGIAGAVTGVGLTVIGLGLFRHFLPPTLLGGSGLHVGGNTLAFALVAAVAGALATTWLALWRVRRLDFNTALHEGGRSGASVRLGYFSRLLVVVQVGLATALLIGSGLFAHALVHAARVPLGFHPDGVLTFELKPLATQYPDARAVLALGNRIRRHLAAQPGVTHVAVSTILPDGNTEYLAGVRIDGKTPILRYAGVGPEYFSTLAIPVIKGRTFTRLDMRGGERVAVVNRAFAQDYLGGQALGKTIDAKKPFKVVGVVGNTRQEGPLGAVTPILYVPLQQTIGGVLSDSIHVTMKVRGNAEAYRKAVQATMAQVAPLQPISHVVTLASTVAKTTAGARLKLLLMGVFAALALLLAAAGIYAVMAVAVASREHEFGVRTTLGASPAQLVRLVLRGGMWQIGIGLVFGIGIAVLLATVMHAMLTQIGRSAFDPYVYGSVGVVLLVSGLLACLRPAWHAGHVAPMRALRGE